METIQTNQSVKLNNGRTIEISYFISKEGVIPDSGQTNLFIHISGENIAHLDYAIPEEKQDDTEYLRSTAAKVTRSYFDQKNSSKAGVSRKDTK